MTQQPEPCINGRCYSPTACSGLGYCRERKLPFLPPSEAEVQKWQARARNPHASHPEPILERLERNIGDWKEIKEPAAIVEVRADLIVEAYQEIKRLQEQVAAQVKDAVDTIKRLGEPE